MSGGVEDALGRARQHLQRAAIEALEGGLALLEAASAVRRDPGANGSVVADVARAFEASLRQLRASGRFDLPPGLLEPLEAALAAEIARWEARSKNDPDARPVLRAFLGLRELLWEIGRRSAPAGAHTGAPSRPPRADTSPRPRATTRPATAPRRVQRFDVES